MQNNKKEEFLNVSQSPEWDSISVACIWNAAACLLLTSPQHHLARLQGYDHLIITVINITRDINVKRKTTDHIIKTLSPLPTS